MARANLKVTQMMDVLHVTRPTAYRLYHGARPYNLQQIDQLAAWIGVEVDDLIREKTP
ncbi:helix-turn-helix domain-containing protein [Agromyces larvae]|uniref:Helix-turn-helix transcriptional regulator n=1 Tax=Agromyces larvae TaxID=2929802 RepID=A0ABY4C211_9MICO|nr:helix-turn-helix domain-containing protein [Agromyces larvae]UOE45515.1 helix-turn-helix transcriptional regulator [Agromyces larvae]